MDDNSKSSFHSHYKSHFPHKQQISQIFSEEIPMRLKSRSSQLFQQQIFDENEIKNPIKVLQHLHHSINSKMMELDKLNCQYFSNQQKLFFKTFINIMDRMSNQLAQTKQRCQNIDEEINQEKQCVQLKSKLCFYKDQSLIMKHQLQSLQKELAEIRQRNNQKQNNNRILLSKLTKQVKKQQKYRHRKYSLQTKLEDFDLSLLGLKRTNRNSIKNRCASVYSHQNLIQIQQQKSNAYKLKRPMTAIKLESGSSKTLDHKNEEIKNVKAHNKTSGYINKAENTINLNNLKYSIPLAPRRLSGRMNFKNNYF